jgi:hypothetical protein
MSRAGDADSFDSLPAADRNAELQRRSIAALMAVLPADKFVFRDERIDDAGVDGSLELLIDSRYTNLRAQVQLKSTDSERTNQDDTISLAVKKSNLIYLLNGQSPLYVLYIAPRGELRFAWARDERHRLDRDNPNWAHQETVTIRFEHLLTPEAFDQIHERIRREAQLQRSIHDILGRAGAGERVVTSIDPETLNNTDPDEAYRLLISGGMTLVSAGYGEQVKGLADVLNSAAARSPRIRLMRAYAEYATGRYQAALGYLAEAALAPEGLSDDEQQLLKYIRDACEYQTGRIKSEEYLERLNAETGSLSRGIHASYILSRLRFALFGETEVTSRASLLDEMRASVARVSANPGVAEEFKLHARLILLEGEGHYSLLASLKEMQWSRLRRKMGQKVDLDALRRAQQDRWDLWEQSADVMLREAVAMNNPLFIADALTIRASVRSMHLLNIRLLTPLFGITPDIPEDVAIQVMQDAERAIAIYSQANQLEGELRARMILAELSAYAGRTEEAQEIAQDVLPKAGAMSYASLEWRARMLLDGQTVLSIYEERNKAEQAEDMDFQLAEADDDTLRTFARDVLKALDLPVERLPVMEREWHSLQDIAREKLHWCRHINLVQDLRHSESAATHYKIDPGRWCVCEKYNYQSSIESTNWTALIPAFKRAYCEGCPARDPKLGVG